MTTNQLERVLEDVAEKYIPKGKHKLLHVNSREAWIKAVTYLINNGLIEANTKVIKSLVNNWELLLINRFSVLN